MRQIDISKHIYEVEKDIFELNNAEWEWRFYKPEKLLPLLKQYIDQIDFHYTDYLIINTHTYWCGCLTLEPWCELEEGEESILNELLHKNTELVIEKDRLVLRYKENPESLCHVIFKKYPDGFGGNIAASFNSMLHIVEEAIEKKLHDSIPENVPTSKYGEWGQDSYCATCDDWHMVYWSDPPHCPDCNGDYTPLEKIYI